jgi:CheY-like chemotaxis protein
VLILAESRNDGEQLLAHLIGQGFETSLHLLESGADWLPHVWEAAPGAIVLDFKLATKRGWEILKVLKENPKTQPTPVLFFGLSPEADTGSVLEMDYLLKPISSDQLGEALAQQHWPAEAHTPKTILVVDDDPGILDLHTRMVQSHSAAYRVLKAADGREALKIIRETPPDLVLLDLMMPGLDGFGVLEAMRQGETTRNIPVIVLTARVLSEADMARLNNGVATVLGKGMFTVQETLRHIEGTLNRNTSLGSVAQRVVRRAMGYLHTHYAEDISREAVAQYVGVSEGYLTRCFRQETGLTLIAYLNRYRIRLAKTLLTGKTQSVTEVALAVGFSNVAYFSRVFHREVGLWPSEYQRR